MGTRAVSAQPLAGLSRLLPELPSRFGRLRRQSADGRPQRLVAAVRADLAGKLQEPLGLLRVILLGRTLGHSGQSSMTRPSFGAIRERLCCRVYFSRELTDLHPRQKATGLGHQAVGQRADQETALSTVQGQQAARPSVALARGGIGICDGQIPAAGSAAAGQAEHEGVAGGSAWQAWAVVGRLESHGHAGLHVHLQCADQAIAVDQIDPPSAISVPYWKDYHRRPNKVFSTTEAWELALKFFRAQAAATGTGLLGL